MSFLTLPAETYTEAEFCMQGTLQDCLKFFEQLEDQQKYARIRVKGKLTPKGANIEFELNPSDALLLLEDGRH